jgi:hypothetical protein
MTETSTKDRSARRLANGLPRFQVEIRTEQGWRHLDSRTTVKAAMEVLMVVVERPVSSSHYGLWIRVRDGLTGDLLGVRQTNERTGAL